MCRCDSFANCYIFIFISDSCGPVSQGKVLHPSVCTTQQQGDVVKSIHIPQGTISVCLGVAAPLCKCFSKGRCQLSNEQVKNRPPHTNITLAAAIFGASFSDQWLRSRHGFSDRSFDRSIVSISDRMGSGWECWKHFNCLRDRWVLCFNCRDHCIDISLKFKGTASRDKETPIFWVLNYLHSL